MSDRFTLLLVCDNPGACSPFRQSLRNTGLRLLAAGGTESAITLSYTESVDGILICKEDIQAGSAIGLQLKTLLRNTPVVLICTGCETLVPSPRIDAVCYTNALDDEMARIVAMLFRDFLIQQSYPTNVSLPHGNERLRPFVVQPR